MNIQCIRCKGRGFCGRPACAITTKIKSQNIVNESAKQDFFGDSPNVFVGKFGYPDIKVGILSTEQYAENDNPLLWSREKYSIDRIIDLRTRLVNSNFANRIKDLNGKLIDSAREVSLSVKPVDVEINLEKKPNFSLSFNQDAMPHGPTVRLRHVSVVDNPKVPRKVDSILNDELKAVDAVSSLGRNFDEHYLVKLFSLGNLGIDKKLVPTRWSITAVDDILGKDLVKKVRDYQESGFLAHFGGHLGNYYLILVLPGPWSYELFELPAGKNAQAAGQPLDYMTDYESHEGRKEYAQDTAGGYYAARLAVLQSLDSTRRKGSVLALRFITDEYWAPLGVWVVREAARNSMSSKPLEFSSLDLILKYAEAIAKRKFNLDISVLLKKSKLLDIYKHQKKLDSF